MARGPSLPSAATKRKSAPAAPKASSMSEGGEEAPQINLLQMGREALQLQRESYPQQLELQRQYGPDFARAETANATARAQAEQAAIGQYGRGFNQTLLGASPEIRQANDAIGRNLAELGPSALEQEAQRQALADLRLGGTLSAEDQRAAAQQARAGFAARGLGRGNTAAVAEVLNRQSFSDARRDQRRGYASAVDSGATARRSADASIANNAFNTRAAFFDPQMRMFGRGGSAVSGQVQGPGQFQPYLNTAAQISTANLSAADAFQARQQEQYQFGVNREDSYYFSEQNLQNSNANAAAQRKASTTNAAIGAAGSAIGLAALAFLL